MINYLVVNTTSAEVNQHGSVPDDFDMGLISVGVGEELVYPLAVPFTPATQYVNLDAYPTITIGTRTAITYTLSATEVDVDEIASFTSITPSDTQLLYAGTPVTLSGSLNFASGYPGEYLVTFSHPRRLLTAQTITVVAP